MGLDDGEMMRQLVARDGARRRTPPHAWGEECRFREVLQGRACPWCEAVRRRQEREAALREGADVAAV